MQTLNTEYKPMQHEELIISAASKTSVTGAKSSRLAGLARYDEIRTMYTWPKTNEAN